MILVPIYHCGSIVAQSCISDQDQSYITRFKWYLTKDGYAIRYYTEKGIHKSILMHRDLLKPSKDMQVDHINHNKLDNQRHNIRTVTNKGNHENLQIQRRNTTGYRGVSHTKSGMYIARVKVLNKTHYLGTFLTPIEAGAAAEQARQDLNFLHNNDPNYRKLSQENRTPLSPQARLAPKNNSTGYTGVTFNKRHGRYVGQLRHNGRGVLWKLFDDAREAGQAVLNKRLELGLITPEQYNFLQNGMSK